MALVGMSVRDNLLYVIHIETRRDTDKAYLSQRGDETREEYL
jgi:hypothetical protein